MEIKGKPKTCRNPGIYFAFFHYEAKSAHEKLMKDFETNLRNMLSLQNWVEFSGQGVHNPSDVVS